MDAMEDVVATEPRRYRQLQNICVIWKFMSVWRTASDIIVICYRLRWRRRTDSKSETLLIVGIRSVGNGVCLSSGGWMRSHTNHFTMENGAIFDFVSDVFTTDGVASIHGRVGSMFEALSNDFLGRR